MNLIHHSAASRNWCFAHVRQNDKPISKADVKEGSRRLLGRLAGDNVSAMLRPMTMERPGVFCLRCEGETRKSLRAADPRCSKGLSKFLTRAHLPAVHFLPDPAVLQEEVEATWGFRVSFRPALM